MLPELIGVVVIDHDTGSDPFEAIIGLCPPVIMPTAELVNGKLPKDVGATRILVNRLTASWTHVRRW